MKFSAFYLDRHPVSAKCFGFLELSELFYAVDAMKMALANPEKRPFLRYFLRKPPNHRGAIDGGPVKVLILTKKSGSTRTTIALLEATEELGGKALWLPLENTSKVKGESYASTARNLAPYYDFIALRDDKNATAVYEMADSIDKYGFPTIMFDIGSGDKEHTFQMLKDMYTVCAHKPKEFMEGTLTWVFLGDFEYSRVIHSDLLALRNFGGRIYLVGPAGKKLPLWLDAELAGSRLTIIYEIDPLKIASEADVWYFARLQKNLRDQPVTPAEEHEYALKFGATEALRAVMKPNAIALHPQPHNQEIEQFLDLKDFRFIYNNKQADNGKPVAMALLKMLFAPHAQVEHIAMEHGVVALSGYFRSVEVPVEEILNICSNEACTRVEVRRNNGWGPMESIAEIMELKRCCPGIPRIPCPYCRPD